MHTPELINNVNEFEIFLSNFCITPKQVLGGLILYVIIKVKFYKVFVECIRNTAQI